MKRMVIFLFLSVLLFAFAGCAVGEGSSAGSVAEAGEGTEQRIEAVVKTILTCPNSFLKENMDRMTVSVTAGESQASMPGKSEAEAAQAEYAEFLKGIFSEEDFTAECYEKLLADRFFTKEFGTPCAKNKISLLPETVTAKLTEESSRMYSVTAVLKLQREGKEEQDFSLEGKVQLDEAQKITSIRFPDAPQLQEQLRK